MTNNKKIFIFDLDDTLYLRQLYNRNEMDFCQYTFDFCKKYEKKIKDILYKLKEKGYKIALASHNSYPYNLLKRMEIIDLFDIIIGEYPRLKVDMINEILDKTKLEKNDVLFLDDNFSIIIQAEKHDIDTYYVKDEYGIDLSIFNQYIDE